MGQRVVFPAVYHYREPPSFSSTCSSCYWKPLFFPLEYRRRRRSPSSG